MIHLFINALAASAGGGLTYVRNVAPHLAAREDLHTTLLVDGPLHAELAGTDRITVLRGPGLAGSTKRFWYEQLRLPDIIRRSRAQLLLSAGNFALYRSPIPQILLSRNSLYTSGDFARDLRQRGDYRLWLDNEIKAALAAWSVRTADCTVAPSCAFAEQLKLWTGRDIASIHHGFDGQTFFGDETPLPADISGKLSATGGSLRLLFVSHYNYYRNFETLIRALAILKEQLAPRPIRLILTCRLSSKENPGDYRAEGAAALVRRLRLGDEIVELGAVSYPSLHHVYRACDLYVTPAYAETFAHPIVEAMASELPVIASDLPVHREICGQAALYFPRFSAPLLAQRVLEAAGSRELREKKRSEGLRRSRDFSWSKHVEELLALARHLCGEPSQILEAGNAQK